MRMGTKGQGPGQSLGPAQTTLPGLKNTKLFIGKKSYRASLQFEDPFQESDYKLPLGWKQRSFWCLAPPGALSRHNKGDQQSTQRALSPMLWKTRKWLFSPSFHASWLTTLLTLTELIFSLHFYVAYIPLFLIPPPQHMVLRITEE